MASPHLIHCLQEEISSPLSAQLLDYYNSELFPETLQNPQLGYEEKAANPITDPNLLQKEGYIFTNSNNHSGSSNSSHGNLSAILDGQEDIHDISASIDFSSTSPFYVPPPFADAQHDQFDDLSSVQQQQHHLQLSDAVVNGFHPFPHSDLTGPFLGSPLPSIIEDCSISSPPAGTAFHTAPAANAGFIPGGTMSFAFCSTDTSGIFPAASFVSRDMMQPQELDYRGDGASFYYPDPKQQIFNPSDVQALSIESQKLLNGHAATPTTPLPHEISTFDDPSFKVAKLSVEERKEKIHRYLKKRNERNFSKKIKYACRKTLADSRPRVRGRFAKNDDFGEAHRHNSSSHEEDDDDEVGMKEEDETVDSSDILAHISGVNSFKCSYPVQSWI
ncbi:hypothetical protein SAY86_011125 [Trapa natans]|uniref:CCT domain-containing protein n=1 Tax=Trapa natans TaxID=22666 RepID=A0AAN7R2H3_TRANT|nr:hypothetical protein SAY86_011125 [Trapa natans]